MTLKNVCIASIILLLFAGCGDRRTYSKTEMVEGIVTLDGVPVEGAEVIFYPLDLETGEGATGKTDEKGMYRLSSVKGAPGKGTPVGEYGVTVSKYITTVLDEPYLDRAQDAYITYTTEEHMPVVYTDIKDSPLKATVIAGNNTINLELVSKAK